jgi:pimeloyl-ACP methyl ester carboxylesterase
VLGGWFALPGVVAIMMALDGRWSAIRVTLESQVLGIALILLGVARAWDDFDKQLPALGARLRTLALDYRDVGDSDPAPGPYTIAEVADDVHALAQALEIESGEGARRVCAAVAGPGFAERHPEEIDAFVEIARHRPLTRDAYLRQLQACRAHDVSDRLGAIDAPTLVLHGDADPLVPVENGRHLAAGIAGARLVVYPGVGHIPEVEIAERFDDDLLAFLALG